MARPSKHGRFYAWGKHLRRWGKREFWKRERRLDTLCLSKGT